jgi:hypothetical protein
MSLKGFSLQKNQIPWWHERILYICWRKLLAEARKEIKGKVYHTIEKTEVFLSLEFFATWVMEQERSNSRYKTIPTLDSGTVDNKP